LHSGNFWRKLNRQKTELSNLNMVFQPGQSGNPGGYTGPRERYRREVYKIIEGLGHKDVLVTLSTIQNDDGKEDGIRVAAASALAPYVHPKSPSGKFGFMTRRLRQQAALA
jgi:hypothetical protein